MNKKYVMLATLSLFLVATAIAPVLAQPAQRQSFTATQKPNLVQPPSPDLVSFISEGNILHYRNAIGAGTISLTIDSQTPISGTTSSIISVNRNLDTGIGDIKFQMTWTFSDGTFEGNILGEVTGPNVYPTLHGVLQGTGAYEGWTVILDGSKALGQPFQWTGTIEMP